MLMADECEWPINHNFSQILSEINSNEKRKALWKYKGQIKYIFSSVYDTVTKAFMS